MRGSGRFRTRNLPLLKLCNVTATPLNHNINLIAIIHMALERYIPNVCNRLCLKNLHALLRAQGALNCAHITRAQIFDLEHPDFGELCVFPHEKHDAIKIKILK